MRPTEGLGGPNRGWMLVVYLIADARLVRNIRLAHERGEAETADTLLQLPFYHPMFEESLKTALGAKSAKPSGPWS